MERLLQALKEKHIILAAGASEKQIISVARAVGIDPKNYLDRAVKIVPYTNKKKQTSTFITTPAFTVGRDEKGKRIEVQGLFLRVEALDQAIEDLLVAKEMLRKK